MKHLLKFSKYRSVQLTSKIPFTTIRRTQSSNIVSQDIKSKLEAVHNGPGLRDFINITKTAVTTDKNEINIPYLSKNLNVWGEDRKVFFEIYGCQMNVNDTEVIWSILKNSGFQKTDDVKSADVILVVTCAIREGAENKIWNRIKHLGAMKRSRGVRRGPLQIGILGCMAERLKTQLLEKEQSVDIVAGPDSYRDLPRLLAITRSGPRAANVLLSLDETYADVMPVRLNEGAASAFVSIMRGCDNMCSYCIVPFTRGRERSRPIDSIVQEIQHLADKGIKEVTLLGQNVNSYRDLTSGPSSILPDQKTHLATGFRTVYKNKIGGQRFADLLHKVASNVPEMRIRFTSPHPKDFPDEVLHVIRDNRNICRSLHLPAQSGSSAVLERMRRGYTREAYLELVEHIRNIIPGMGFTSDFICGFCGETEEEFQDTLSLIESVKYHMSYFFAYSMREKTTAHRRYADDIPDDVKGRRLRDMVKVYRKQAEITLRKSIGERQLILIEGLSKRSAKEYFGRNDQNIKVIIPIKAIPLHITEYSKQQNEAKALLKDITIGDFVAVKIENANSQVMKGVPLYHTTIQEYYTSLNQTI